MTAVGGSLKKLSIDGRKFSVLADADVTRKLGNDTNEVQMNGDNTGRLIKTSTAWSLDGVTVAIDDLNGDHEFLESLANSNSFKPMTLTYASGAVWSGSGQITGDLGMTNMNAAASLNLMGAGKLVKQ